LVCQKSRVKLSSASKKFANAAGLKTKIKKMSVFQSFKKKKNKKKNGKQNNELSLVS